MTGRIAGWSSKIGEDVTKFARRTTRSSDGLRKSARVPSWDLAVAAMWWCWAGHLARLTDREPHTWACVVAGWRDAWLWQPIKGVLHTASDAWRHSGVGTNGTHWISPVVVVLRPFSRSLREIVAIAGVA